MITLYHLAISHYSEKVRWALDIKLVPHAREALIPGLHRLQMRRVAGERTAPALVDTATDTRLGESSAILQWLDENYPVPLLYPPDGEARTDVVNKAAYCDENVGGAVAGYSYAHLIDFPKALKARWTTCLSARQRPVLSLMFPIVRPFLRRGFELTPENTARRGNEIHDACDQIERWLMASGTGYLAGGDFTAADLTAASLLGPLLRPEGSPWAATGHAAVVAAAAGFPPPSYVEFRDELMRRTAAQWALGIWRRHRRA